MALTQPRTALAFERWRCAGLALSALLAAYYFCKMLYQKLLEIAETPFRSKDEALGLIDKMLDASMINLKDSINVGEPKALLFVAINRIDNTWNLVSKKTGGWINQNAFSTYIKEDEQLSKLLK